MQESGSVIVKGWEAGEGQKTRLEIWVFMKIPENEATLKVYMLSYVSMLWDILTFTEREET